MASPGVPTSPRENGTFQAGARRLFSHRAVSGWRQAPATDAPGRARRVADAAYASDAASNDPPGTLFLLALTVSDFGLMEPVLEI